MELRVNCNYVQEETTWKHQSKSKVDPVHAMKANDGMEVQLTHS